MYRKIKFKGKYHSKQQEQIIEEYTSNKLNLSFQWNRCTSMHITVKSKQIWWIIEVTTSHSSPHYLQVHHQSKGLLMLQDSLYLVHLASLQNQLPQINRLNLYCPTKSGIITYQATNWFHLSTKSHNISYKMQPLEPINESLFSHPVSPIITAVVNAWPLINKT